MIGLPDLGNDWKVCGGAEKGEKKKVRSEHGYGGGGEKNIEFQVDQHV